MFIQNIPATGFGRRSKRDFSSFMSSDAQEDSKADLLAIQLENTENNFLNRMTNALIRHLLKGNQESSEIPSPALSGRTAFALSMQRPDRFYQDDCMPCKEIYRAQHIVHREVVPYVADQTFKKEGYLF